LAVSWSLRVDCLEQAVDADERAVAGLDVQVGAPALDERVQCLVDVEHTPAIGASPSGLHFPRRVLDARPGCFRAT
jgi:hypothetical protein